MTRSGRGTSGSITHGCSRTRPTPATSKAWPVSPPSCAMRHSWRRSPGGRRRCAVWRTCWTPTAATTPTATCPRPASPRTGSATSPMVRGQLVGEGALIAESALDQVADELFRRYTRDAAVTGVAAPRRPQLLAEAFVELCRRGLAVDVAGTRAPRTEATVVVNAAEPDRDHRRVGSRAHPTPRCSCATRCCVRSSPRSRRCRWRWAVTAASPPRRRRERSTCVTAAACSPAAPHLRHGTTSTTPTSGAAGAPPTSSACAGCVGSITVSHIVTAGTSRSRATAGPSGPDRTSPGSGVNATSANGPALRPDG